MRFTSFKGIGTKAHGIMAMHYSKNMKLVVGSLLSTMAAIFQSAGLFGGIGYAFSMMATGPIVLVTVISLRFGLLSYAVTTLLLMILQPSEVLVFMFTTGLLGISLGVGFILFQTSSMVSLTGGLVLATGIFLLLYLFQFPILGPLISSKLSVTVLGGVLLFALFYSWLWMGLSKFGMKHLNKIIFKKVLLNKNGSSSR